MSINYINEEKLERAKQFAIDAHESIGQMRKYGEEKYYFHPLRVAETIKAVGGTENMIIAAKFHDILEDVLPLNSSYGPDKILRLFGPKVLSLVFELTDVFTKEAHPQHNRKFRKVFEAARLASISDEAKIIKMADIADNSRNLDTFPGFNRVWIEEKARLIPLLLPSEGRWLEAYTTLLGKCGKIK